VRAEDFAGCRYIVQAFDSTEWSIGAANGMDVQAKATAAH